MNILIALQHDQDGTQRFSGQWDELAAVIEKAPSSWRWYVRRKLIRPTLPPRKLRPDGSPVKYISSGAMAEPQRKRAVEYQGPLFSLPNVEVLPEEFILSGPIAAMLKECRALVTHSSAVARTAASLGVPAFFWAESGPKLFPDLIASGEASYVKLQNLEAAIAVL